MDNPLPAKTPDPVAPGAPHLPLRVVKVGGSLLDWQSLPNALRGWLGTQPPARNLLICGGGPLTDAIRRTDEIHALGETAAHWLCIDALSVTARLLASLLGDMQVTDSLKLIALKPEVRAKECRTPSLALQASIAIFDPRRFLIEEEPGLPGCVLPHDWSATTDSIAARLAEVLHADELVLLKSADPPPFTTLADLAAAGYSDLHFLAAAAMLRAVRYVNLRARKRPG